MELLGGWDRVRGNLVGTFFLEAKRELLEKEFPQPAAIILQEQTYAVQNLPVIALEREYRTFSQLDESLESSRQEYRDKQKEFELRWNLCSESNDLLEKFISRFYLYYETSQLKKEALQKLQEQYETELAEECGEVSRLKKELAKLKDVKAELDRRLEICLVYKEFMNSIVEESKFEDVSQLMSRYYELRNIRENQVEKTVKQVETAFELENELKDVQQESKSEEVACKTYLSDLENYHNRLQVSNWRRHDNLLAIKAGLKRELLKSYTPKVAIHNLYLLLCQELNQPAKLHQNQFRKQLQYIQKYLKELTITKNRTKESLECPSDVPLVSEKSFKGRRSIKK